jgi:hypothetical protein
MAPRSPNSKTAAIAGTLAGLLAAGLGAYYLYSVRHETQPSSPSAPSSPIATVASAGSVALQAPAAKGALSREQAVAALMALPELKAWADKIEKDSKGHAHGALMEYDAQLRAFKGKQFYQLSFVENSKEAAQRWESFLVAQADGEILVDDDVSGEPMTLEQWRKEKKPMQRSGAGE